MIIWRTFCRANYLNVLIPYFDHRKVDHFVIICTNNNYFFNNTYSQIYFVYDKV